MSNRGIFRGAGLPGLNACGYAQAHVGRGTYANRWPIPIDGDEYTCTDTGQVLFGRNGRWYASYPTPGAAGTIFASNGPNAAPSFQSIGGVTAPTGTGIVETTAGSFNAAATAFADAAIQVSSFNLTGLTVPVTGSFTTIGTIATATNKTAPSRMQFTVPASSGGSNIGGIVQGSISAPWTIDLALQDNSNFVNQTPARLCGIVLYDGTKCLVYYIGSQGGNNVLTVDKWNSVSSFSATLAGNAAVLVPVVSTWLRWEDDSTTNWSFYTSSNGLDYTLWTTVARNTFLTPTKFGIIGFNNTTLPGKWSIRHWLVSNSALGDAS